MAGLSTHVLDTSKGKPAVELKIELYKILNTGRVLVKTVSTNQDGRIDGALPLRGQGGSPCGPFPSI